MSSTISGSAMSSAMTASGMTDTATMHLDEARDSDFLSITPLGSGNEVGRSCHILSYKGKTVMLDCGIHPAGKGIDALPYFDQIDADKIDILLITHFHLDHAAALPYFLEQTNFKGRVFMTHPTKSIYKLILQDYVKVSTISVDEALYDEADLMKSMDKIEAINFHEVVQHKGIKFRCYHAGHVLGAAMFLIEIAGVKVLYTGDYSRQQDRHLMGAEVPEMKPDVLIIESTWGIRTIPPIEEREKRFTDLVHQVVMRGGRVLIPVFALGRAQELLLILDEYWEANPSLQSYPIYYASALAKKCMTVYRRYINMMNEDIRARSEVSNPFNFRHVLNLRGLDHFDDIGPSVVMASPGMLQNGLSRQLFELWCSERRNGCILAGYCVEGTLAKSIQSEPETIMTMSGLKVPLKMSVHEVSFSAHADFTETSEFIEILKPKHVVLVHGESNQMMRLKQALLRKYEDGSIQITSPRNCQTIELEFRSERMAKVIGCLSKDKNPIVSGLLVRKDFNDRIMDVEDLATETPLASTTISQSLKVPFVYGFEALQEFVGRMYAMQDHESEDPDVCIISVMEEVTMSLHLCSSAGSSNGREEDTPAVRRSEYVELQWQSNPFSDIIADSLMCILLSVDSNVASAKLLSSPCDHGTHREDGDDRSNNNSRKHAEEMRRLLLAQFEEVTIVDDENHEAQLLVQVDGATATIVLSPTSAVVECDDDNLLRAVENVAHRAHAAVYPLAPQEHFEYYDEEFEFGDDTNMEPDGTAGESGFGLSEETQAIVELAAKQKEEAAAAAAVANASSSTMQVDS